jgi:hypothetical protein
LKGFVEDAPTPKTWKEVAGESCIPQYQTGSIANDISLDGRAIQDDFVSFTLGKESCDSNNFCNGPLKPGTTFSLILRVFTSRGWSDTDIIYVTTENEVPLMLISISILSVMFVVFVAGFYISYRKTRTLK